MRRFGGLALLLAVAALIGACGSTYTKQDFIAQADAICAESLRQTRVVPPPSFAGSARAQRESLATYLGKVVPIAESEARRLHALKRPPGDQAALDAYLGALDTSLGAYRNLLTAARGGDAQGVTDAENALRASRAAPLAKRVGLRTCGAAGATG